MKLHPFSIKYVEKIKNSNEIIFHDNIRYDRFKLKKDKHSNLTMLYNDPLKNIEKIYALMHTDISNYVTNEKNFLLHGDIYFIESRNIYVIFSFKKYIGSSSIMNHGFFFLDSKLMDGEFQLMFNMNKFKSVDEFFTKYITNESELEYVGNFFIHDVETFMPEPFTFDKTYKLDLLRKSFNDKKVDFYYHSCFNLIESYEDEEGEDAIRTHSYKPRPITIESVRLCEYDDWEIGVERIDGVYNYRIGKYDKSSIALMTGYLYECKLNPLIMKKIKNIIYPINENKRVDYYMKFFVFYTHKGIVIKSLVNDSLESFYFDDNSIGFDVWDSFDILSDKSNRRYKQELLKIL